jgi:hypothetical protein
VAVARSTRVGAAAVLVIVLVIVALAIAKSKHFQILPPIGSGCVVHSRDFDVPLSTDQAGIAAIIAGVAAHRSMPPRAVTIAYATALQESDLANLPYGDRDSVGVFQQRPSQGWGTRAQLLDPVYASAKFFAALARVPRYQHVQIYQAAQAVQRSADGTAYSQYAPQGAAMAGGFTGSQPHAVWCWYGDPIKGHGRLAAATREMTRAFGRLPLGHFGDPSMTVRVRRPAAGWAVAAWLVTHASGYGIGAVRYDGYQWTAAHGQRGWTRYAKRGHRPAARLTVVYG